MKITLTDGGIETRIIYEFKHLIGDFESFELLQDESGRHILRVADAAERITAALNPLAKQAVQEA